MNHFEVEIKSLIGTKDKADKLIKKLDDRGYDLVDTNNQLNHYFTDGNLEELYEAVKPLLSSKAIEKLSDIIKNGTKFSVRTRQLGEKVLLVVKSSINNTSSENGTVRMEFEEVVEGVSLDELDEILLSAGFQHQAKWSRQRREYKNGDISITIDKNAGYGYLAEFETLVQNEADTAKSHQSILSLMNELDVPELSQERLGRMFEYYNKNWRKYYGTDKVFTIE